MSERPWEREGWCDESGKCWWGRTADEFWNPVWHYATWEEVQEFCNPFDAMPQVSLPHNALPLPAAEAMTTDLRALCAKLVEKVECTWGEGIPADVWELLARARALLAQLEDGTLTNEELRTVMPVNLRGDEEDALAFARAVEAAVIARFGHHPAPLVEGVSHG